MTRPSSSNRSSKNQRLAKATAEQQRLTIGNMRLKTDMCRYMEQHNYCPFGDHCQYAHSLEEKVVPSEYWKGVYRTKPCAYLARGEECPYSTKCAFLHDSEDSTNKNDTQTTEAVASVTKYPQHHNQSGPFSVGIESLRRSNSRREPSPELKALILECSKIQSSLPTSTPAKQQSEDFAPAPLPSSQSSKLWSNTEINQVLNFNWCSKISSPNFAINPVALFAKLPIVGITSN